MIPAPITANAATAKVVGVGKTFTVKKATKVSGLSKAEKKIVKVTVNKKKRTVTVKGVKAGKATFKIGKKAYTVKVGATKIAKKTLKTTMTAGTSQTVSVTATAGKGDTIKFASSNKAVLTVNKTSAKASAKGIAKMGVKAVKEGKATLTVSSKNTGVKKTFKITVKAAAPAATNAPTVATTPGITTPTATVAATKAPSVATTPAVQTTAPARTDAPNTTDAPEATTGTATTAPATSQDPAKTEDPNTTKAPNATETPQTTKAPETVTGGTITVTTNATGAAVTVLSGTSVIATGTAVNGVATIPNVENGTYVIKVEQAGFNTNIATAVVNGDTAVSVTLELTTEFTAAQIGRNTVQVTGEDLTNVATDYVIKKGKTEFSVSEVAVSEDKKTAKLTLASTTMSAGDYSLTFDKKTATFAAKAEVMDKIEIVGNNLVVADLGKATEKATIKYRILNQFGERMTSNNISATCGLGTAGVATGLAASRTEDGTIEVTLASDTIVSSTKGTLVLVDTKTGKSATAEVVVSAKSAVASVKIAGIYKDGKMTNLTSGEAHPENYALLLKAYDQYGNETTAFSGTTSKNVTITVAGTTGLDITADDWSSSTEVIDDETYIKIPFKSLVSGSLSVGTSTVTIVGDAIGLLATYAVNVTEKTAVTSLEVAPIDTLYINSTTEMEYTALDNEGNLVTDYNALKETNLETKNADFKWVRQKDGSAKLYFTPTASASGNTLVTGTDAIPTGKNSITKAIDTSIGNSIHVTPMTIYAQKVCTNILGLSNTAPKAALKDGNEISYKLDDFVIADQYGNTMNATEKANDTVTYVKIKLEDATTAAFTEPTAALNKGTYATYKTGFYATIADIVNTSTGNSGVVFAVKTTADEGTAKVTFSLATASDGANDLSGSEYTTTIKSTDIEKVSSFAIGDVPSLYIGVDPTNNTTDWSSKAVDLTVTGKVGGLTVTIPKEMYQVISTTDHVTANSSSADGKIKAVIPAGGKASDIGTNASVKETLKIAINNAAGTVVSKDVTVSNVAPTVTTVELKDSTTTFGLSKTHSGSDTIGWSDITTLLSVKDQYDNKTGVSTAVTSEKPRITFTNIPEDFSVNKNNTPDAELTIKSSAAEKTYTVGVELTYANGVTYTETLVVTVTA